MLHGLLSLIHFELLDKRKRVSLHDVGLRSLNGSFLSWFIVTVDATALLWLAELAFRKAFAVELQTARSAALTLVRQGHRLQHKLQLAWRCLVLFH